MLISHELSRFKPVIRSLPKDRELTPADLLTEDLLMAHHGDLQMYYAPHNEYLAPSAKAAVIGITPGWTQMRMAMEEARSALERGFPDEEVCRLAKEKASFAGTMRVNLIEMWHELGLHRFLQVPSCEGLFEENRQMLHTTSLLRFPVFARKRNYTGSHPALLSSPFLRESALASILEELRLLDAPLIIPLGKTVEKVLALLVREGKLDGRRCLWGFPHPSGANGHRRRQFAANVNRITEVLHALQLRGGE